MIPSRRGERGFTLAELLVACTLLAIVMSAVYTSFNTSLNLWRIGSSDLLVYQDARLSMSILTRELQSVVAGTGYRFIGDGDELEFFTVTPSMDVEEGLASRVMWVRYDIEGGTGREGKRLRRTEALVEGPLPLESLEDEGRVEVGRVRLGGTRDFVIAEGIEDFRFSYWWIPPAEEGKLGPDGAPDLRRAPVERKENKRGTGLPQGVRIDMTVRDAYEEEGEKTFTTFVTFNGPTTEYSADALGPAGGL